MVRDTENTGFICLNCNKMIEKLTNGSYRNHCPFCLYSLHVDLRPGDRLNTCQGLMAPVGVVYKAKKGWQIVHSCLKCRKKSVNKVAVDTMQPDDCLKVGSIR